jgi:phenylalanyl-tRNA synthetase beta chain
MNVPLRWLRDYVDLTGIEVPQLVERLTLAGLEVAAVRCLGVPLPAGLPVKAEDVGPIWASDKVVVGRVLQVEKHPNADKLTLVTIEYGAAQPKVVVTGAPNIHVGDAGYKVVLGLSGTAYIDGHAAPKQIKELKPSKIRGVPSDAMVMSEFELGISEESEGVIVLADDEAPAPGTPAVDFLGDVVLEIDVLPNMARCLSMIGVAREVAALFGRVMSLPPHAVPAAGPSIQGQVEIRIEDPNLSARYAAALIIGVRVGRSPAWMQQRLTSAGMRPISNIVDITNYVMLEWGQPLHAFDLDKLIERAGGKTPVIEVRSARAGEVITTLDNVRRELTPENLMIADRAGPIAIAGVMGGADTEVTAATRNILLESANFDFVSVRRTMKALNLPSEASIRFSRGIHPEIVQPAAERAAELMRQYAGGTVAAGLAESYPAPLPQQVVELSMAEVRRQLGMDLPVAEAERILRALEFGVEQGGPETLRVTTPPHRLDVQAGAADLIEELVRVYGYERLPATLMADQLPEQHTNRSLAFEERLRDVLVGCGLQEVITYALTEPERDAPVGLGQGEYVRLLNPISSERVVMRHSLLGGVLAVAAANLRNTEDMSLFEIGSVYLLPSPLPLSPVGRGALEAPLPSGERGRGEGGQKFPDEPRRLALLMTGRRQAEFWGDGAGAEVKDLDFFDLKGVIEAVAGDLHLPEISYRRPAAGAYPCLHPGRSAELLIEGRVAGGFGQLHPNYADQMGLGQRAILAGELDLEPILTAVPARYACNAVPRFPAALRDIAVIVDEEVTAERIAAEIRTAGGDLLADVRLFDLYRGEPIPSGKKSLAYALSYQPEDRTLVDREVDKLHKKIEDRLKHVLKALIRGKD